MCECIKILCNNKITPSVLFSKTFLVRTSILLAFLAVVAHKASDFRKHPVRTPGYLSSVLTDSFEDSSMQVWFRLLFPRHITFICTDIHPPLCCPLMRSCEVLLDLITMAVHPTLLSDYSVLVFLLNRYQPMKEAILQSCGIFNFLITLCVEAFWKSKHSFSTGFPVDSYPPWTAADFLYRAMQTISQQFIFTLHLVVSFFIVGSFAKESQCNISL